MYYLIYIKNSMYDDKDIIININNIISGLFGYLNNTYAQISNQANNKTTNSILIYSIQNI